MNSLFRFGKSHSSDDMEVNTRKSGKSGVENYIDRKLARRNSTSLTGGASSSQSGLVSSNVVLLAEVNAKYHSKEKTSSKSSGSAESSCSAEANQRTPHITTIANLSGTPLGMFQSKKKESGTSAPRMAVFRTHAEERELHHQKQCLIDGAIDAVIDRMFAKELKRIIAILSPEYGLVLRKDHATKIERLIVRLEMAVVADPSTLLLNRDQSFVDTRGGGSTDTELASENGSGKEAPTCSVMLLPAPVNNGEEVLQRVLAQGGSRSNPLVSARSRRTSASTSAGAVSAPQSP